MTSKLNQQAREALTRALPYISPGRREVLVAVLMGEEFNNYAWTMAERNFVASADLEFFIQRLFSNGESFDTFFIHRINEQVDYFESLGE